MTYGECDSVHRLHIPRLPEEAQAPARVLQKKRRDLIRRIRRGRRDDAPAVDGPAGHHLREPQPWQYMTPAELIAEIGGMQKDR